MSRSRHTAWDAALDVIRTLRASGHAALLAGGCVRDRLLGRAPKDYDVVTDAVPPRVAEIFPRARHVGAKFGVMLVRRFGHDVEVATFRAEGPYLDGRHPQSVRFGSEQEDARRRDFTINGLFLDPLEDRLIDHVGGREDLRYGLVRTIGDPEQRFREDHLRMLRAVRFAAALRFRIDAATHEAVTRHAPMLTSISAERIWMEIETMLIAPTRAIAWSLLIELGLRPYVNPDWPADATTDALVVRRLGALPGPPVESSLALAAAACDHPPTRVRAICHGFRLSNRLTRGVVWLVRALELVKEPRSLELADLKTLMARPWWDQLLSLFEADLTAQQQPLVACELLRRRCEAIAPEAVAPPPLLTGDDLCAMGMSPGPPMGRLLDELYRAQLNEQIRTRRQAEEFARARFPA